MNHHKNDKQEQQITSRNTNISAHSYIQLHNTAKAILQKRKNVQCPEVNNVKAVRCESCTLCLKESNRVHRNEEKKKKHEILKSK